MESASLRRTPLLTSVLLLLLIPVLTAGSQELKGTTVPYSPCNPRCPPDQWCGRNLGRRIKLLTNRKPQSDYICLDKIIDCRLKKFDCPSESICRKSYKGNCCYPRTCAKKCGAGQRCRRLLRRCPRPPPNAPPCYCPPIYRCVDVPQPKPLCDPPCHDGTRCGVASGFGAELVPKKYTCVRDECSSEKPCPRGSACKNDQRGNCCRFVTCSKKCADNEVCAQLPPTSCYNPGPHPPPCFCQQGYACMSRCQPPCGKNEWCAVPFPPGGLEPASRRYTCLPKPIHKY